jgi:effector-binding domain-containing protein
MKKVLYVIIGLIVVYLILCIAGPSVVKVERSTAVNAPATLVMKQLGDLPFFQEKWSPWREMDPNMTYTYTGTPGTVGHKYNWEGNDEVGKGSLELTAITQDSIIQNLHFEDMGDSKTYFAVKGDDKSSNVTWGMEMRPPFFFRAMALFMNMEKMVGEHYEKGLANFKQIVETMPKEETATATTYDVKEVQWEEKTFIGKRQVVTFDKIPAFFGENLGRIMEDLGKNKIEPMMAPLGIFWTFDEKKQETDMAAAMCVPAGTKLKGYDQWVVPASKVLHVAYYGDYSKTMNAHMAIDEYMKKNNLTQSYVIEEYANDPAEVKDTAQWLTNIYYVINK